SRPGTGIGDYFLQIEVRIAVYGDVVGVHIGCLPGRANREHGLESLVSSDHDAGMAPAVIVVFRFIYIFYGDGCLVGNRIPIDIYGEEFDVTLVAARRVPVYRDTQERLSAIDIQVVVCAMVEDQPFFCGKPTLWVYIISINAR